MALNFRSAPYFDDYTEEKEFLKILYRPGFAVQARELTQSQDILQNQVSRLGSFVFKSGSQVLGGQVTLDTNVNYANVNPLYQNTAVNLTQFANNVITDAATRTVRASVITVAPQLAGSNDPPTLMLKYLTGTTFANGANITVETSNTGPFALLANTDSQGIGSIASLQEGVFFIDLRNINAIANANANSVSTLTNGYFVRVPQQTIILEKYNAVPTYRVGLQVSDAIVTEQDDSSLLDPALGSTNYQAPGAARYLINSTLSKRGFASQDDTTFIELMRISQGQLNSAQKLPVLGDLNNTLALRTYEQSGSFTVTPFSINFTDSTNNDIANANTQQYNVALDAGTAYVEGYRYQTVSKTFLSAPRARTTVNVSSANIQTYYGNYLLIDTVKGEFNISTLPQVDLHCVTTANVIPGSTAYANTLMGTARLRALEYNSSSNTADGLTYVFRAHLFDVNTGSISSVSTSSGPSNVSFGPLFSTSDNAYAGMQINIPFTGDSRYITSYTGSTKNATVDRPWTIQPANGNTFTIINSISAVKSLGLSTSSSFVTANSNINIGSKNQFGAFQNTTITDTNFQPLIFRLPNSTVAQGLNGQTYQYRYRVATGQTLQVGTPLIVNLTVPGDATAVFSASGISGSDLTTLTDFLCVTVPGGGVAGQIVPMTSPRNVAVTDTTATFTMVAGDPTFTNVDVFASIDTEIGPKTKTLITPNTTNVLVAGGTAVGNATVYLTSGQVYFLAAPTSELGNPSRSQDLYISDAISVVVVDSGAPARPVSDAMVVAAASNSTVPGGGINITNNFIFNGGQKDTYYDHASLTLKPGAAAPIGQVLVLVTYWSHSATGSYFSVDSYPDYTTIPVFNSPTTGAYSLRDCLDFRPRRDDVVATYTFSNSGTILLPEPLPSLNFEVNFAYYLPRIDQIILTKNGDFRILQGDSSLNPSTPKVPDKSMILYTLTVPPYTFYSANVIPKFHDNKRYTMADIGTLDKRISAVEYYTALNNLEQSATQQTITDANGLSRPKNGILVDNFQGSSIADVTNLDYYAAIDQQNNELRPAAQINNIPFNFNSGLSSHYARSGKIFTLPYSTATFIDQSTASRTENLNPFNLTVWNGTMKLDPESDTWVDTAQLPAVITNLSGDNDAWAAVGQAFNDPRNPYSTSWNSWQTYSAGTNVLASNQSQGFVTRQINGTYVDAAHAQGGWSAFQTFNQITQTTTTQTVQNQVRTGIQTTLSSDVITKPIGTNLVDISVVPFIRSSLIHYVARSMKPLTNVHPYFDNVDVTPYTLSASVITFTSNVAFQDTYQHREFLVDQDGGTNGGLGANSAEVYLVKDNKVYVHNTNGVIYPGKTFRGSITGLTGVVQSYYANHGYTGNPASQRYQSLPFTVNVTPYANSTSIVLRGDAANTDGTYVGNVIRILSGTGIGRSSIITAYNGASRIATVSPAWNITLTNPKEQFYYQIGPITTDENGDVEGAFVLPSTSTIKFHTGTSVFLLTDASTGNVASATTKAQDSYTAQGTLETTQQQFVSTRVPVLSTKTVQQTQAVVGPAITTSQVISDTAWSGYFDPIAQNFIVDARVHPNGVFITSIRVCFFSKDRNIPVTLQLRPTNNGYPDAGTVIPFSEVIKLPNQINTTLAPSLDNASAYTEFTFDAPIYLLPGQEYSIILISNSNNYLIYTAVVGDKYLGSDRLISQPPYLGVFFKSQNASTWTPFQGENMMFRINKATFDNSLPLTLVVNSPGFIANVPFSPMPNTEVYIDAMYLTNQDQQLKDTSLSYGYRATANTTRILDSGYSAITTNKNAFFPERKVLTTTGNAFFIQTSAQSQFTDISPIIDLERYSITAIADQINNGGLSNTNITITQPGMGYNISNTNIVTISGGGGSSASAQIGSVDANGNITSVIITTGGSGSGYTGNATGTIVASGYTPTRNAAITIGGETNPSGGNFLARYITRMVTLAQGMDAGDLNVTFDAHKPVGTQIYVYYKILSAEDTTVFKNRPYVLMSLEGNDAFSTGGDDFTEYNYVGSVDSFGNPTRSITYGSFNSFKYYAIKIVMSSNNPAIVPRIANLRTFALPATH